MACQMIDETDWDSLLPEEDYYGAPFVSKLLMLFGYMGCYSIAR